tara:strand:+ start:876 stop:980 length:105 start_codon:yes stop_codon:yes gene_type:complete
MVVGNSASPMVDSNALNKFDRIEDTNLSQVNHDE